MAFGDQAGDFIPTVDVHSAIKRGCQEAGVRAHRVDEVEHSGSITALLLDQIKRHRFLISDLTHERPNTKPFADDAVLGAIRNAINRSCAALADAEETRALREGYALLSPREREVMALVVSGRSNKQVGGELGISEITVKAHRGRMMRKMNAASICDLVRMASRLSLGPRTHTVVQ